MIIGIWQFLMECWFKWCYFLVWLLVCIFLEEEAWNLNGQYRHDQQGMVSEC